MPAGAVRDVHVTPEASEVDSASVPPRYAVAPEKTMDSHAPVTVAAVQPDVPSVLLQTVLRPQASTLEPVQQTAFMSGPGAATVVHDSPSAETRTIESVPTGSPPTMTQRAPVQQMPLKRSVPWSFGPLQVTPVAEVIV